MSETPAQPVTAAEAAQRLAPFASEPVWLLAVSGGPDSMALMALVAHWRALHPHPTPDVQVAVVDHRLRAESGDEALFVQREAARLGVPCVILPVEAARPSRPHGGVLAWARDQRYALLAAHARACGARLVMTAHTLEDQAETVLMRLGRGSGLSGLAGMRRRAGLPGQAGIDLARPWLDLPKAALIATCAEQRMPFVRDPSNHNARFARARWRSLAGPLAAEGVTADRLARLAERLQRADDALAALANRAFQAALVPATPAGNLPDAPAAGLTLDPRGLAQLEREILVRVLLRATHAPPSALHRVERAAERLSHALCTGDGRFRQTLAGHVVRLGDDGLTIAREPPRRRGRREMAVGIV